MFQASQMIRRGARWIRQSSVEDEEDGVDSVDFASTDERVSEEPAKRTWWQIVTFQHSKPQPGSDIDEEHQHPKPHPGSDRNEDHSCPNGGDGRESSHKSAETAQTSGSPHSIKMWSGSALHGSAPEESTPSSSPRSLANSAKLCERCTRWRPLSPRLSNLSPRLGPQLSQASLNERPTESEGLGKLDRFLSCYSKNSDSSFCSSSSSSAVGR